MDLENKQNTQSDVTFFSSAFLRLTFWETGICISPTESRTADLQLTETAANAGWRHTKITACNVNACQPAFCSLSEVIKPLIHKKQFRGCGCLMARAPTQVYSNTLADLTPFLQPPTDWFPPHGCSSQTRNVFKHLWISIFNKFSAWSRTQIWSYQLENKIPHSM